MVKRAWERLEKMNKGKVEENKGSSCWVGRKRGECGLAEARAGMFQTGKGGQLW